MSKATADLMNEHEAILSAIQILDRMVLSAEKTKSIDQKDIRDFIAFLKEFTDKCHHGKEEGFLFPALVKAGVPDKGGPVGLMLIEHAQGRALIKEMEEALSNGMDLPKLTYAAKRYSNLLRQHIQKENGVLFPMADKVLTEPQLETIFISFEEHEEKVIGHGRHEQLHAVLKNLQDKYPA